LKNLEKGRSRTKNIILLEHEKHVKNYLKRSKKIKGQKLVIALSPFAMYELDKQNFSYKIPEDYYSYKELYKLGINYQKVENLCNVIDKSIHDACPHLAELGIKPAMFGFPEIKTLYDTTIVNLFQLFKLIDLEKPDVIFTYAGRRYPFGTSEDAPDLYFDCRESIYAQLLTLPGWSVPIKVLPYIPHPEDFDVSKKIHQRSSKTFRKAMLWWLRRHPKLFDLAAEANKSGWHGLLGRLKSHLRADRNMQVILFGQGYEWDYCREQLQSIGIDPIFIRLREYPDLWIGDQFPDKLYAGALLDAWEELRTDDKFREIFVWNKINFFPVLEEHFRFLVEHLTPACLNVYEKTAEIIKKRKVKALLAPSFTFCTGHSASQAARNSNIPVVTWQHGAYGFMDEPMKPYTELMSSDAHFVYGEGVVDRYTEQAKRLGTQLISIGSPSLEALYRTPQSDKAKKIVRLDPEKKVVVYVLTVFFQNGLTITYYPLPSDNHKWRDQLMTLNVLGKHDEYTVVVKTKPCLTREPPLRSYAREREFKNCQFVGDECAFTDLLPIADLFVFDTPTTAFLQALTTSKPIFVHTQHLRLDTQAQKLLERRAFCYQDPKGLADALDKYLSEGKIEKKVDLNDKEFLKAYGISSLGMGSGVRAAKMLKRMMLGRS
jgi:hypothetical protein